jgi:O-antigen ligase
VRPSQSDLVVATDSAAGEVSAGPSASLAVPPPLVVATALGGSMLAGALLAYDVQLGIAAALAICYGPLALLNPQLAIVLWLPTVSLIAVSALGIGPNLAGGMIAVAWFGALATRRSRIPELVVEHGHLLLMLGALVLWMMLSMAWAELSPFGSDPFFGWLVALAIVLVISTTLTDRRYLRLACAAFVVGAVISVAIGLLGGAVQEETERVVGGSGDPNFLAAGIVPAIVLAAGLGAGSSRLWVRFATVIAVAALTIGLVATESRGGLIAAVVAVVGLLVLAKRQRAWVVGLLLCVLGVAGAWFSVDPAAWERISDLSESTGRTELWTVAWQMWQDHPIAGVGLQGFVDNASGYVRELGPFEFSEFITEQPKVVHNTYLELLAESGLIGLALFLAVAVGCLRRAWQAAVLFERGGDMAMATLSRTVIAATLAMLAAAFFISAATDRRLWVLLALGPALLASVGTRELSVTAAGRRAPVGLSARAQPGASASAGRTAPSLNR